MVPFDEHSVIIPYGHGHGHGHGYIIADRGSLQLHHNDSFGGSQLGNEKYPLVTGILRRMQWSLQIQYKYTTSLLCIRS